MNLILKLINIFKLDSLFLIIFIALTLTNVSAADSNQIQERYYNDMGQKELEISTLNLLQALETIPDGETLSWQEGIYKGYVVPVSTVINEQGYFCRDYLEVLIRLSKYEMYENKACRDHDGEWVWIQSIIEQ